MSRNGKVIIAMSGGVDSSVAACRLHEQGYDCVGVFMRVGATATAAPTFQHPHVPTLPLSPVPPRHLKHGCCSVEDALDARAIAGRLGIPFYVLNFQPDFDRIIDYFVDEYARARTPNPCILCNIHLKFGKLLRYADMLEAEFVASGHYARIVRGNVAARERGNGWPSDEPPPVHLARAKNLAKDQSYVLFGIQRTDLPRCLFPLGEIADKAEVRRIAADLGLRVHDKPDSQEICFVPEQDYTRLVRDRRPQTLRPGEVRDASGRLLGTHEGVANFTIGQRRGLRIATGQPIYVTQLDAASNAVTVGPRASLLGTSLVAEHVNWLSDPPPVGEPRPATIKIRHMHAPAPGSLQRQPDGAVAASFDEPQLAITPGQAAVFYDSDIVLGGGWIVGPA